MPVLTAKEELAAELNRTVRYAEETRERLIADMDGGVKETLYAIRWLGDAPMCLAMGEMAQQCLQHMADSPAVDAATLLDQMVKEFRGQRERWYPETSTSPWSNAVNDSRYNALRRFNEQLEQLQKFIARAEN